MGGEDDFFDFDEGFVGILLQLGGDGGVCKGVLDQGDDADAEDECGAGDGEVQAGNEIYGQLLHRILLDG